MRTTVDIPDSLSRRVKRAAAERGTTMRELIIDALEQNLEPPRRGFRLRDASAGQREDAGPDAAAVNAAIDALREPDFRL